MNTRIIFTVAIALLSMYAHAQEKTNEAEYDKGERYQSYKSRSSQGGVAGLLQEAREIKDTNPKEALDKVKEALGMSIAQGNTVDEGRCYLLLGEINESIEEWKLALENFKSAYEKFQAKGESPKSKKVAPPNNDLKNAVRGLGNAHLKL